MAGSASVLCLLSMTVLLAVGTTALTAMSAKQAVLKRAVEVDQAFMAAEAGVDLAVIEIHKRVDHTADGIGVASGEAGGGRFDATVTPAYAGAGFYTITSTGRVGNVARTLEVVIDQEASTAGFLSEGALSFTGSGFVDSYDAETGSYASQVAGGHAGSDVTLRSNGNITVGIDAEVFGNAMPGVTGSVLGAGTVTGSTAPASTSAILDPYTYAPPIASMGALSTSKVFTTGQYRYSTFAMGGGRTATFTGNVELWVDGDFTITGSGLGILTPGSSLVIHHGSGIFRASGNSIINQNQLPSMLTVKSATTATVEVGGTAAFYGTVMAPQGAVTLFGNSDFFGAAQGKSLTLSGSMSLHYDVSLGSGSNVSVQVMRPRGGTARKS